MSNEEKGKKGNKSLLWGAALGAVVGSVTALLLAPKPGKELRKDIAEGARQVGEKGAEVAEKVGEQGAELVSKVKNTTEGLIHDFQEWRSSKQEEAVEQVVEVSSLPAGDGAEIEVDVEGPAVVIGISTEEASTEEAVVIEVANEGNVIEEASAEQEAAVSAAQDTEEESKA